MAATRAEGAFDAGVGRAFFLGLAFFATRALTTSSGFVGLGFLLLAEVAPAASLVFLGAILADVLM